MNDIVSIDQFRNEVLAQEDSLKMVLPDHIDVKQFVKITVLAVEQNPALLECERQSLFQSLSRCASDGLIPDGKDAALIPFNTKAGNKWVKKAQYMPMVAGILKRARQSGQIATITARCVYANDEFDYWVDEDGEHIKHKPFFLGDRGEMVLVYAMAKMKSGDVVVEPMGKEEIEKVRQSSKQPDGVWKQWPERMAEKSALHRIARRLPNSSEIAELTMRDNFMYELNKKEKDVPREISSSFQELIGNDNAAFESLKEALENSNTEEELNEFASIMKENNLSQDQTNMLRSIFIEKMSEAKQKGTK